MSAAQTPVEQAREALLAGDPETAAALLEAHTATAPADHEARYWLASALLRLGRADEAAIAFDDARLLHGLAVIRAMGGDLAQCRSDGEYAAKVAANLYGQHLVGPASAAWGMAISNGRIDAQVLVSYGLSLQHQGRVEEASQIFGAAAENFPSPAVHQFLLFPQLFCEDGQVRHARESMEWARLHAPAAAEPRHANPSRQGRPLRIGYVAPNFAGSQLRQFMIPLLEAHDPSRVKVILYPARRETETGWPAWIDIHPIGDLDDAAAAELIRSDGVDVLVDCWGHTAGSRLSVFARRPAPVQAAWLNFIQTTGLPQMDYVLYADGSEAVETDGLFTEQLWPIGPVFSAFRPAEDRLPAVATPALRSGRVTFGSFNHPAKLSDGAVAVWAAILRSAPAAQLLLKYAYFADPVLQRSTQARFAAHGVAPERIIFEGRTSGKAYYEAFQRVDLALDPWPAPGATTTLEALSNGVPVLSLAGPKLTPAGLFSRTMLDVSGLGELVADSPEDYVAKALELTADIGRLNALRARVRPGFEAGACCDGPAFAGRLEAAFGEMFDAWAKARSAERGAA